MDTPACRCEGELWNSLFKVLLVSALFTSVFGCGGNLLTYKGDTLSPGESIILLDGTHSAYWQTRDLKVNYTYQKNPSQLEISGTIYFAEQLAYNFENIIYFNLELFLVDETGTILQSTGVVTSPNFADSQRALGFKKSLNLSPGTAAMAFGYTGEARGTGELDEEGTTSFFHSPVQR